MEKINDISTELSAHAMYGKLSKQGGMRHNVWQERWCICSGGTLDYFEQATDNQAKGSIGKLRVCALHGHQSQPYCAYVCATRPGRFLDQGDGRQGQAVLRDHPRGRLRDEEEEQG
jgi:hypothetical protein